MKLVIFPRRSLEPENSQLYRSLLNSEQVQRFYLNELQTSEELPLGLELLRLIVSSRKKALQLAKRIVATPFTSPNLSAEQIIDLVIISMVYKFPNITREAIMQMLELATELQQTRFYQDLLEEGRAEEGRSLVLRLLNRRVGTIAPELKTKIEALTIAQLEDLGEALLDFASVTDLEEWLAQFKSDK